MTPRITGKWVDHQDHFQIKSVLRFCEGALTVSNYPLSGIADWKISLYCQENPPYFTLVSDDHWPRLIFGALEDAKWQAEQWLRAMKVNPKTGNPDRPVRQPNQIERRSRR